MSFLADEDEAGPLLASSSSSSSSSNSTDHVESSESDSSWLEIFSVVLSNVLLFCLIFGLSATVDMRNLRRQLKNKFAIGTGVGMQFVIMPLLGYLVVVSLQHQGLTQAMGITLLVVTSSPGGSYSNWFCSTFNADLALSVTMTSISSLLSVALLPANLLLYTYLAYASNDGIVQSLDFKAIFVALAVVMAAIFSGLAAGYNYDTPSFHVNANRVGTVSGVLLILVSFFLSNDSSGNETTTLWSHGWSFYVGVAAPCLLGLVLANIIARTCFRLSPPEVVTLAIECSYQNIGIASSVALTMFTGKERAQAVAVPLFYGIVEAVAIGIYCIAAWKMGWTKAPPNENFCVVVTKTYEVLVDEDTNHHDDQNTNEDDEDADGDQLGEILTDAEAGISMAGKLSPLPHPCCPSRSRLVSEDNTACTASSHTTSTTASPISSSTCPAPITTMTISTTAMTIIAAPLPLKTNSPDLGNIIFANNSGASAATFVRDDHADITRSNIPAETSQPNEGKDLIEGKNLSQSFSAVMKA